MKIMFFIQDLGFGGVLRQVSQLASTLDRRGHDVSVVAMYTKDGNWEHLWNADSVSIRTLFPRKPYMHIPGPVTLIKAVSRLKDILGKEETEIVYTFVGNAALFVSLAAVSTISGKTKLVWGIRGSGSKFKQFSDDIRYKILLYAQKCVSPYVPLVISNSDEGLSFRLDTGHKFIKQIVIYNGIDTEKFKPDSEARNRLRLDWGISKAEILIGTAGRIVYAKGFHLFLQAASIIIKERPDVRFVCIGDGEEPYKRSMELLGNELGISDRLIWSGFKKDMNSALNTLDIFCSSSYGEGFPNVVGEAMACGVPCVVTDVGASAKIVGDLGIVVPSGDARMLAEGLREALNRLADFDSRQLRRRVVDNFSVEKMVDRTEMALREVLNDR